MTWSSTAFLFSSRGSRFSGGRTTCLIVFLFLPSLLVAGTTLRVACFNLRNYTSENRVVEGDYRFEYPRPEAEKAAVREVIREVKPDILCVQEMGPAPYLKELQSDLAREGLDYPFTALMAGADPDRHTAILSQVPFAEVKPHADLDFPYFGERVRVTRGLLEVVFETEGTRWHLFNVHLHSRYTEREDDPEAAQLRVKEARAMRDYLKKTFDESGRYLVTGDFNATRESAVLRRFLQVGERELSVMIDCYDSRGERWTYHYAKADSYDRIDYFLASPRFAPQIRTGHGKIFDGAASRLASDHRLLWVDVVFD